MRRFVYGASAMAEANGKGKQEGSESDLPIEGFVPTMRLLEQDMADWGPWTDEDEEWFQIMVKEFGGDGAALDD
jgi:hypothetical protein